MGHWNVLTGEDIHIHPIAGIRIDVQVMIDVFAQFKRGMDTMSWQDPVPIHVNEREEAFLYGDADCDTKTSVCNLLMTDRERLQVSLERFFRRLPVDKPVIRNNYFIQINRRHEEGVVDREELAWATTTLGSEDGYNHTRTENRLDQEAIGVEGIRLRSERQTLRRLGRSGAIVFTIRTYLTGVRELASETGVPGRLASALRSWPEDVGDYKGKKTGRWWGVLLEYLDACHDAEMTRARH